MEKIIEKLASKKNKRCRYLGKTFRRSFFLPFVIVFLTAGTVLSMGEKPVETKEVDMDGLETAVFAGGCFWCMEPPFEQLEGVEEVLSGYAGGSEESPSYRQVASGGTSHMEAVEISYDPNQVTYADLVETYWRSVDPTQDDGQFADRGEHYRTAIFYKTDEEKEIAEKSKKALGESGVFDKPIVVRILPFKNFYPAEDYHQDYYKKNPAHYKAYSWGSGRKPFLKKVWGK